MFSKIAIRNIPVQIFQALEAMAKRDDRSTEAEARQALKAWVDPILVQESRNTRRKVVAARLNQMLAQVNALRKVAKMTPSHLAEAIQEEHAEVVEDWFLGEKEPSFRQLDAIATHLGVDAEWLKHGDKKLFPPQYLRLSENPVEAVNELLTWPSVQPSDRKVKTVHLIRADDKTGAFYIVLESDNGHFRTFYTPIHVSEEIGAGGEASLAALCVTLELLYKRYTKMGSDIMVLGYLLRPDDIDQLMAGDTHPGSLLKGGARSMWWEDIWDKKNGYKQSYWTGWKSMCERIDKVIATRTSLSEVRNLVYFESGKS